MTKLPDVLEAGPKAIFLPRLADPTVHQIVPMRAGMSVGELVDTTVPSRHRSLARVTINEEVVPAELWASVRPKTGSRIVVRVVPGNSSILRSVLLITATVAAAALGQFYLSGAFGAAVATATGIGTAASWGAFAGGVLAASDDFAIVCPPPRGR